LGDPPGPYPFPGGYLINFDSDFNAQDGTEPTQNINVIRTTTWKRNTGYSITQDPSETNGFPLKYPVEIDVTNPLFMGAYFNRPNDGTASVNYPILEAEKSESSTPEKSSFTVNYNTGANTVQLTVYTRNGATITSVTSDTYECTVGDDHYVGVYWDPDSEIASFIVDGTIEELDTITLNTVSGATVNHMSVFCGAAVNNASVPGIYLDELVLLSGVALNLDIISQYYNSGLNWTETYSAADAILLPAPGGVVRSMGDHVVDGGLYSGSVLFVETGSGSVSDWVKYADGRMEAWGTDSNSETATAGSKVETVTFDEEFYEAPVVIGNYKQASYSTAITNQVISAVSTTAFSHHFTLVDAVARTWVFHWHAIGRWKA
jgi:hypothetical protein